MDEEILPNYSEFVARRKVLGLMALGAGNLAMLKRLNSSESGMGFIDLAADSRVPQVPFGPEVVLGDVGQLRSGELPPPLAGSQGSVEPARGQILDTAIMNGRVIDPESGFDGIANVGVVGNEIATISREVLTARQSIDAENMVVAPGFIDLLSYEPNPFGTWFKLADGVTTNLSTHGVNNYAPAFFRRYEGASPIHYGGSFHHHFMRGVDLEVAIDSELSAAELEEMVELFESSIGSGFAGISFAPEYSPGTTKEEMIALAKVAAANDQVCFFHARSSGIESPNESLAAIDEVLEVAKESGAACHIQHITSTGGTYVMGEALSRIETARAEGHDVTACLYPYTFWGTFLASERFSPGWQQRYGLDYEDLQIAGTSERLTKDSFESAKRKNLIVAAIDSIPREDIEMALSKPWVMFGSDAILTESLNNHPRAAGTFAASLGRIVRELGWLDLPTALAKMTILPALRVQKMLPSMAKKGRLQRGADADIVVFDPETVVDNATIENPDRASSGIEWVLVDGIAALAEGELQRDVVAGVPQRS